MTAQHTTTTTTEPRNDAGTAPPQAYWSIVMRRELMVKLTDKAFVFGTALTIALIAAVLAFSTWRGERTNTYTVTTLPADSALAAQAARLVPQIDDKVVITATTVPDAEAATAAVRDGRADAWLHPGTAGWVLTTDGPEDGLLGAVQEAVRTSVLNEQAAALGTTAAAMEAGSTVTAAYLKGDATKANIAKAIGFAFAVLSYMAALMFGIQIANSVVEEKQSRIVEIIATSIPLRHLLAGKVLGNTVLALVQIVVYSAVGLAGMAFTPYRSYVAAFSGPVVWFLVFFVAGFLALASLWAVAGSLASRTEDLQSTTTPLTMMIMVIFFSGLFLQGRALEVVSFVPPLSSVLMPMRIAQGGVPVWQPVVALVLLGLFAAATVVVGERLYRRSLLQNRGRVSVRAAWSAAE